MDAILEMINSCGGSFTVLAAIAGSFAFLWSQNRANKNEIKELIDKLDEDIKAIGTKMDSDIRVQTQRSDQIFQACNQRSDQLYQMFIDLLKAQNPRSNP